MPKRQYSMDIKFDEESRYFLNPESVSEHLFCSICQEVYTEPQRAPCGHSYCKKCILPWLKQSGTCPEDRKPLRIQQLHHDFIVENIIGDQKVACPFRRQGCDFIGQLSLLSSHKKHCDFNPSNLPEFLLERQKSPALRDTGSTDVVVSPELDDGVLPEPAKPSLAMRLFRAGEGKRQLLTRMLDDKNKENSPVNT